MWYLITAIISGAVGAFLMGLVAGSKLQEEKEAAFKRGMSCGWIPCKERLPDTPAPVLITIKWADDDLEVTIGEYWSGNDGWGLVIDGEVTAWKPLPEPAGKRQKSYTDWELRRE